MRISDVVLLVSWLSDGAIWSPLQQGLVPADSQPSESVAVRHSRTGAILTVLSTNPRLAAHEFSQEREFVGSSGIVPSRFCGVSALVVERTPTVWSRHVLLDRDGQHGGSPTVLPTDTASAVEHSSPLNPGFRAMVLNAGRDECKERPCVWLSTSGRWAIVSSDDMLTEVPVNQRVALLDISANVSTSG